MTVDKFTLRNNIISAYLQEIASRQQHLQNEGLLQLTNPKFREVLSTQERLLTALERLLDQLMEQAAA
jgi:hypothetical protein